MDVRMEGGGMYGTCARMVVKQENREAIRAIFKEDEGREIKGYVATYVLSENDSDNMWLLAIFEDRATYDANADDPRMNETYVKYRALLEEEPEWHDGEIEKSA
jgi:quinol monooxygenase YgiN